MSSEIAPAGDKDLPLILYVLYATAASLTYALLETIFWGKDKVERVVPIVVHSILPHADFGPNNHQEDATHFTSFLM